MERELERARERERERERWSVESRDSVREERESRMTQQGKAVIRFLVESRRNEAAPKRM